MAATELDLRSLDAIGKKLYEARLTEQLPQPDTAFMYLLDAVDDMYALLCSHIEGLTEEQEG